MTTQLPSPASPLKIGTRGSPLALAQAYETRDRLMGAFALPEDAFEVVVINDVTARTNALMSGQVHAINAVDFKTVTLLGRNPKLEIVRSAGGQHFTFLMDCTKAPFTDVNARLAIKYAVDREQLLKTALNGFGQLGNDHPIPQTDRFYNTELEQRAYDPEKAQFHAKKAGFDPRSPSRPSRIRSVPTTGAPMPPMDMQSASSAIFSVARMVIL